VLEQKAIAQSKGSHCFRN